MERLARTAAARRRHLRETIAAVWEERAGTPPVTFVESRVRHRTAARPVPSETSEQIGGLIGLVAGHHHSFVRRELPRINQLLGHVRAIHGTGDIALTRVAELWAEVTDELFGHVRHEERLLFPLVIGLLGAVAPVRVPPDDLLHVVEDVEIEDLGIEVLLTGLGDAIDDVQVDPAASDDWEAFRAAIAELEADTRLHLGIERTQLFPAVVELTAAFR